MHALPLDIAGVFFSLFQSGYFFSKRSCPRLVNFACAPKVTKVIGFQAKTNSVTPPLPPALCDFQAEKRGILKSCPRVPKLWICLLRGWGRSVKVTLQTCAQKKFCLCRWGDKCKQKIFMFFTNLSPHKLRNLLRKEVSPPERAKIQQIGKNYFLLKVGFKQQMIDGIGNIKIYIALYFKLLNFSLLNHFS